MDVSSVLSEKYKGMEWSLVGNPATEEEFTANFTLHKANGIAEPTWTKIQEHLVTMQAEYDALEYQRLREPEYPTIAELVVALYDTDDKTDIDKRRADIKAKYPKQ
tara:strand:+ start:132 stop:449 length:318 start_codon:yes stop_codon:yes gene_type:complete